MRIVVDTNRIIASLIKNSYSRDIIFNNKFEFFTPQFTTEEIYKYKSEILEKSGMKEEDFDTLFSILFEKIKIVSKNEYESFLKEAEKLITDPKDFPFVALCLAINAEGIWTEDKHFLSQKKIKIFTTQELSEY